MRNGIWACDAFWVTVFCWMKNVSLVRKFHTSSVPSQFTVKCCVHNIQLKVWTAARLELLSILLFFLSCAFWMVERVGKWWKCAALYLIFQRLLTYAKQIYFGMYKGYLISALNLSCSVVLILFWSLWWIWEQLVPFLSFSCSWSVNTWVTEPKLFAFKQKKKRKFYVPKLKLWM